jgi:hypothetical protein
MSRMLEKRPVFHVFSCRRDFNQFLERMEPFGLQFVSTTRGPWIVAWIMFPI